MRVAFAVGLASLCLVIALAGEACSGSDGSPADLRCVRGHDEVFNDSGLTEFVCDEYAPTSPTP